MKKLAIRSLFLAFAGLGCATEESDTTPVGTETVTVGDESAEIDLDAEESAAAPEATYANAECAVNEIQFDSGDDALGSEHYDRLDTLGGCILTGEITELHVVGVDDPELNADNAHDLAQRRAVIVIDYLRDDGVPEPDLQYVDRHGVEGFVLRWPDVTDPTVAGL